MGPYYGQAQWRPHRETTSQKRLTSCTATNRMPLFACPLMNGTDKHCGQACFSFLFFSFFIEKTKKTQMLGFFVLFDDESLGLYQ